MADAAAVDATAQSRLVEAARTTSLGELRQECARIKAAARPDAEARRRAIHEQRYLHSYTDAEGAWNLRARDNPEVGAQVMAAIDAIRDRAFEAARAQGRPEPVEAYAVDALAELARAGDAGSGRARSRAKVIVGVDLPALLRGQPAGGEACELAGLGPRHTTVVELLDRLCSHHHDLKSFEGWMLVEGRGKRRFVPPGHPEHPSPASAPHLDPRQGVAGTASGKDPPMAASMAAPPGACSVP